MTVTQLKLAAAWQAGALLLMHPSDIVSATACSAALPSHCLFYNQPQQQLRTDMQSHPATLKSWLGSSARIKCHCHSFILMTNL